MSQEPDSKCSSCGEDFAAASPDESAEPVCPACKTAERRKSARAAAIKLLPPKFLAGSSTAPSALGPNELRLPNSEGGSDSIDDRVVKIQHKGQVIELVKLTDEQRKRRRLIYNSIAIALGIGMLWLAYQILKS